MQAVIGTNPAHLAPSLLPSLQLACGEEGQPVLGWALGLQTLRNGVYLQEGLGCCVTYVGEGMC